MITIEPTYADILDGRPGDARACPLALAINRKLKPGRFACVTPQIIWIRTPVVGAQRNVVLMTPPIARSFIYAIDRGSLPTLRSIELDIPEECLTDEGASP